MTRHAKSACEEGKRRIRRDLTRANFPFFKRLEVEKRIRGNILPVSFIPQAYKIRGLISFPALFPPRLKAKRNVLRTRMTWGMSRCDVIHYQIPLFAFPVAFITTQSNNCLSGEHLGDIRIRVVPL